MIFTYYLRTFLLGDYKIPGSYQSIPIRGGPAEGAATPGEIGGRSGRHSAAGIRGLADRP